MSTKQQSPALVQAGPVQTRIATLDRAKIKEYENYFTTITPRNAVDVFKRWLLAYASVHTTWESTCRLYNNLRPLDWLGNDAALRERIIDSRAGIYNNRTKFIMQFTERFWNDTDWFTKRDAETWLQTRDRIEASTLGLGRAKVAFALEMTYFDRAHIVCADTHFCQMYGFTPGDVAKLTPKTFDTMENHWTATCAQNGISPVTARWITFDERQGATTSRYWSHVLET